MIKLSMMDRKNYYRPIIYIKTKFSMEKIYYQQNI
jgi:hypothetical protein